MSNQFNGFINCRYRKCKDKKPIETSITFVHDNVLNDVWDGDWGVILPEDVVCVDSDTMEESHVILQIIQDLNINCYISESSRGYHFYFRVPLGMKIKNGVNKTIPLGLIDIDYKCGQQSNSYIVENKKGVWNNWIKAPKFEERINGFRLDGLDIDELPYWLYPLKINGVSLLGMGDGDGRNDELFKLKCRLANIPLNQEQINFIFRMINTYVFKTGLNDSELNVLSKLTANLAINKNDRWFDAKNNFLHHDMAEFLTETLYCYKDYLNNLYWYNGEYFSNEQIVLEQNIAEECSALKDFQIQEVIKRMRLLNLKSTVQPVIQHDNICVRNGIVNTLTGKKSGFSPSYFIKNQLDIEYDANAYDKYVDKFLEDVLVVKGDKGQRLIFEEYLGYTLCSQDNSMKKMLFMIGVNSNNGKSTTQAMVQHLLTSDNYSALKLNEISQKNDKILVELVGKIANFDDDADSSLIKGDTMSYLKTLISDENKITINPKFQKPYKDFIRAKFWVASNFIIKTEQKGNEWMSRLLILSFNNIFDEKTRDINIKNKLTTEKAKTYLLKLAIDGYKRLKTNGHFSESEESKRWIEIYQLENDSVFRYLNQHDYKVENIANKGVKAVYITYKNHMEQDDNGYPVNIHTFEKRVIDWYKDNIKVEIEKNERIFKTINNL